MGQLWVGETQHCKHANKMDVVWKQVCKLSRNVSMNEANIYVIFFRNGQYFVVKSSEVGLTAEMN